MSSENLLKTIDNNMGDSLLNDSGYLQSDATAKRVDQKRLETFSISHKRSNNYNEINLEFLENLFLEALKNEDQFINQKVHFKLQLYKSNGLPQEYITD